MDDHVTIGSLIRHLLKICVQHKFLKAAINRTFSDNLFSVSSLEVLNAYLP